MKIKSEYRCHQGTLKIVEHESAKLKCAMTFSIYLPDCTPKTDKSFVTFLSGLTCTHENFTTKAGAYGTASDLGLVIVAPDTSPRGENVPDDVDSYDFGQGAGFYLDAIAEPWAQNYQMESYITKELLDLVCNEFQLSAEHQGVLGHSMGGHGALTLFMNHPKLYKSVSAFSPIVAPAQVPWGKKAFSGYLGSDEKNWQRYDACQLMLSGKGRLDCPILIDQGLSDNFFADQLKTSLFQQACYEARQTVQIRYQEGFDHSYYFIQSFIADHLKHHAEQLA